jgi:copper chaperone CopZ
MRTATSTAVVEVSRMYRASSKAVVESALYRGPGVVGVDLNPVAQTATVTYDPAVTSVAEIAGWVRECGYRCEGCCVPQHLCDPMDRATLGRQAYPSGPIPAALLASAGRLLAVPPAVNAAGRRPPPADRIGRAMQLPVSCAPAPDAPVCAGSSTRPDVVSCGVPCGRTCRSRQRR